MSFEVELKFHLPAERKAAAWQALGEMGAEPGAALMQVDRYFNHPARDFRQTDEALRIRQIGGESRITYKGPKVGRRAKTRREIELPVGGPDPADGARLGDLLESLGFRPVREVRKRRQTLNLPWDGRDLEIAFDEVDGLGAFIEIETVAQDADRDAAEQTILAVAARLGLTDPEPRSYLGLLLAQDAG
jgi:adenylate cyclase class 2